MGVRRAGRARPCMYVISAALCVGMRGAVFGWRGSDVRAIGWALGPHVRRWCRMRLIYSVAEIANTREHLRKFNTLSALTLNQTASIWD